MAGPLERLEELRQLVDSAELVYLDWIRINADGTDVTSPHRKYAPGESDDQFSLYCSNLRTITDRVEELRESAIASAVTHSTLNNRQLAIALGISHTTVARRRAELSRPSE